MINTLEAFSLKTFGKGLRKHNNVYDLETFDYMDESDFIEFLETNVTKYNLCNFDYLQEIQWRAM